MAATAEWAIVGSFYLSAVYQPDVYTPHLSIGHLYALVVHEGVSVIGANVSQLSALVTWGIGTANTDRSRAWTFVMDGHTFYVLDLGEEGTFLYDMTTKQWCQFVTDGYTNWNMHNGTMWGRGRISGGDNGNGSVWELSPDITTDQGFKNINHVATGVLLARNRVAKAVESFKLACSLGQLDSTDGGSITLRWSDDNGVTWVTGDTLTLVEGDTTELAWRSLGAFAAPGRIFEISDVGGILRIDGADAAIEDFDEDTSG